MIKDSTLEERLIEEAQDSESFGLTRRQFVGGVVWAGVFYSLGLLKPSNAFADNLFTDKTLDYAIRKIRKSKYIKLIDEEVVKFNSKYTNLPFKILPEWIYTMAWLESNLKKNAISKRGAKGLLQLKENTVEELAKIYPISKDLYNLPDIYNPRTNISLGIRYLALNLKYFTFGPTKKDRPIITESLESFSERFKLTLAGYNTGPHGVIEKIVKLHSNNMKKLRVGDEEKKIGYDDIRPNLPRETKNYVANCLTLLSRLNAYNEKDEHLVNPKNGENLDISLWIVS